MRAHRPDWDSYFMEIARIVSKRSTCMRRSVGSVIVKSKRILSTGYNGAPIGLEHCIDMGCLRERRKIASGERHELCRGLHAEQNAIIQAAYHGVSINGADLYSTHLPCSICIKMIINAGIEKVLYSDGYPDELSLELIRESGITVRQFEVAEIAEAGTDHGKKTGRHSTGAARHVDSKALGRSKAGRKAKVNADKS
ncbi:MAG: Riboflavin biosynthesis protein RibD [Syntrophorhabdus sp. PtaB.Bin006]|nr:MAG: Riboflavin biosynthesis protein RibD [Syntrophorhabdus sp. PtaB.Bin006]